MLFTYDPSIHDYSEDKPEMVDIGHNHFVYGNKKEIEEYKRVRESGVAMKSITIADPDDEQYKGQRADDLPGNSDVMLERPLHDTGSNWYLILSLFLPVLGLIGGLIFKKYKHIRNWKACKKGAIIGFSIFGAVIALFCILLLLALV